jgi:hypothetical protein
MRPSQWFMRAGRYLAGQGDSHDLLGTYKVVADLVEMITLAARPDERAVYVMFLVSEVHPFDDGNGWSSAGTRRIPDSARIECGTSHLVPRRSARLRAPRSSRRLPRWSHPGWPTGSSTGRGCGPIPPSRRTRGTGRRQPGTSSGLIRGCPLRAPTVCRSNSGAPAKLPPTRPWLARNSAMVRWLNWSAGLVNDCPLVGRGCPEERLAATRGHRLRSTRSRSLCARRDTSASKAIASYSCGTPGCKCSSTGTPAWLSVSA